VTLGGNRREKDATDCAKYLRPFLHDFITEKWTRGDKPVNAFS
jgi:hypothetical protein